MDQSFASAEQPGDVRHTIQLVAVEMLRTRIALAAALMCTFKLPIRVDFPGPLAFARRRVRSQGFRLHGRFLIARFFSLVVEFLRRPSRCTDSGCQSLPDAEKSWGRCTVYPRSSSGLFLVSPRQAYPIPCSGPAVTSSVSSVTIRLERRTRALDTIAGSSSHCEGDRRLWRAMTRFGRRRNVGDRKSGRDLCAGDFTKAADRTPWGNGFAGDSGS